MLGAAGYLKGEWTLNPTVGSAVRRRIWELEKRRHHVPWVTWGQRLWVAGGRQAFGQAGTGRRRHARRSAGIRMCLGYTGTRRRIGHRHL